jgi:hypothetical protein
VKEAYTISSHHRLGCLKNKQALGVVKPSSSLWHHRLGHASTSVVQHVLSRYKLSFVNDVNNKHVCDACQ